MSPTHADVKQMKADLAFTRNADGTVPAGVLFWPEPFQYPEGTRIRLEK